MQSDVSAYEAIKEAVEDGKLEPSSREVDFIDSIEERVNENELTTKQSRWLWDIHERIRAW